VDADDDLGGLDRVTANERHFLSDTRNRLASSPIQLQCECTHTVCDQRIELSIDQYEPLRTSASRYAIYPHEAHVDPGVDQVVERQKSHWVVERQPNLEALGIAEGAGSET
jgi:hypothetical protein